MKKREEKIQLAVCKYVAMQYKDVIFHCDVGSGVKLPIGVAAKAKMMRSSRGYPDLFIAEPRGKFSGLYIEIKSENSGAILKDGSVSTTKHVQEQHQVLKKLTLKGYVAVFGVGFDECKKIIDKYMKY